MNDWLVRMVFAIFGLVLYWILPDPWGEITGWAALATFIWMAVQGMRTQHKS